MGQCSHVHLAGCMSTHSVVCCLECLTIAVIRGLIVYSTVHSGVRSCHDNGQPAVQLATRIGKIQSVLCSSSPSNFIFFVHNICVHENVRKEAGPGNKAD